MFSSKGQKPEPLLYSVYLPVIITIDVATCEVFTVSHKSERSIIHCCRTTPRLWNKRTTYFSTYVILSLFLPIAEDASVCQGLRDKSILLIKKLVTVIYRVGQKNWAILYVCNSCI